MLETKDISVAFQAALDADMFEGYATIFGVPDEAGDIVEPGAFAASLARRPAGQVKMLYQHDPMEPIGVWEEVSEDATGLYVRGRLVTAVPRAASVLALMREGALDGLSIGFRTAKAEPIQGAGRRLVEVDLWEISIVTFPMLAGARTGIPAVPAAMPPQAPISAPVTAPAGQPAVEAEIAAMMEQAAAAMRG